MSLKYTHISGTTKIKRRQKVKIKSQYRHKFCEMIENALSGLVVMHLKDADHKKQHTVVQKALKAMKKELEKEGIDIPDLVYE